MLCFAFIIYLTRALRLICSACAKAFVTNTARSILAPTLRSVKFPQQSTDPFEISNREFPRRLDGRPHHVRKHIERETPLKRNRSHDAHQYSRETTRNRRKQQKTVYEISIYLCSVLNRQTLLSLDNRTAHTNISNGKRQNRSHDARSIQHRNQTIQQGTPYKSETSTSQCYNNVLNRYEMFQRM